MPVDGLSWCLPPFAESLELQPPIVTKTVMRAVNSNIPGQLLRRMERITDIIRVIKSAAPMAETLFCVVIIAFTTVLRRPRSYERFRCDVLGQCEISEQLDLKPLGVLPLKYAIRFYG